MPPKFKFSKEQILDASIEIIRENGSEALTARALAQKLDASAKPIFTLFKNMKELEEEVICKANELYEARINDSIKEGKYPPYKASGMAYIKFARDEKELFKLLFMRDRSGENIEENREPFRPILEIIMKSLNVDEDTAVQFHLELWLFVHGIATMTATSYLEWDVDFIDKALSDAYLGLKSRYEIKEQ